MSLTTDPDDPRLGHGSNEKQVPQNEAYLVLSAEERAQGFVRPLRTAYLHLDCPRYPADRYSEAFARSAAVTTMGRAIAETYAREPGFYGATYCIHCCRHRPVGADGEFVWLDQHGNATSEKVGT